MNTNEVNTLIKENISLNKNALYIKEINKKFESQILNLQNLKKINDDKIIIPTLKNINILTEYNYNTTQLKIFLKKYNLTVSGNKNDLLLRLYSYLKLTNYAIKIQKVMKGYLYRNYINLHGPAFWNRSLCTNDTDFYTMDYIKDIPYSQFFSYKDVDNFIYGFDIISLYNLINKTKTNPLNPYNRKIIPENIKLVLTKYLKLSKILNIKVHILIQNDSNNISFTKLLELKILTLFQNINALGNYSDHIWFHSLDRRKLVKFMRELIDIWSFRAQLTMDIKRSISPPNGNPFIYFNFSYIETENNIDKVKNHIVETLEKLINIGIDENSRSLGAFYILGALTLVNNQAAQSLPWLYQSFSYNLN